MLKNCPKNEKMSTNIRVKKVCIYCNQPFIAKTTFTKFCSRNCNNRYYKEKKKEDKVTETILETNATLANQSRRQANVKNYSEQMMNKLNGDWLCLKDLAHYLGIGERTIFR